jgi:hypothetical protein
MRDIESFEDIKSIVDKQYAGLISDETTSRHFKELDFDTHLPRIYNFWTFILEVDPINHPYKGSAFEPHTRLGLTVEDFRIWQHYLKDAILSQFEGPVAVKMLQKAEQLGMMFEYKLGLLDK